MQTLELTENGKSLVITLLFRLLFGGYVVAMDQYLFNDLESALTVVVIYGMLAAFAALFMLGKRVGLLGMIGLEAVFVVLNSVFLILALSQIADAGLHDPLDNWWATLLRYLFSILTLVLAVRVYRETKQGHPTV